MADNFLAEIRNFPFNFAPTGWAICSGQLLPISQNTALFSLLGTQYGGDGKSTFGLPNLQGSIAIHTDQFSGGGQFSIGESGGTQSVTLLTSQMPSHTHTMQGDRDNNNATATSPRGAVLVNATPYDTFSNSSSPALGAMNPAMMSVAGSNAPHNNLMPTLTMQYCIAMQGIFPARS